MTIHFPDLSHYKTPSLDGAVALITKATQGTAFVDATYAPYKRDADARGIPFAGYHWVDTSDLGAQAALAWRVMGGVPCMWDAEAAGATVPRLLDLTKRYRALGGNPRLVYLPRWWWQDHLGSPDLRPLRDAGLALVSSVYPKSGYTEQGVGWLPYGGVYPEIWQYTDAHPFNGQLVDFNAYRGTVEQLRQLLGLSSLAPEDDMLIRVNETGAIWTVDPARTWRRYVDGPEFKQAWAGQGYTSVPQAQVDAGWWGRDITTVATPGSASGGADEVRKIVDEELDEAFRGGADADS
jgi:hypothetical protein